jgi:hypothetical protein
MNNSTTQYDVDYFIRKFEAIPDSRWGVKRLWDGDGDEIRCAMGHCLDAFPMMEHTAQTIALRACFRPLVPICPMLPPVPSQLVVFDVNNGDDVRYPQPTPKARILAALQDIKAKQQPKSAPVLPVQVKECVHLYLGCNCVYCGTAQPVSVPQPFTT